MRGLEALNSKKNLSAFSRKLFEKERRYMLWIERVTISNCGERKFCADRASSPKTLEPQVQRDIRHVKGLDSRQKYMAISDKKYVAVFTDE